LRALYVRPAWQGRGPGGLLLRAVAGSLARDGRRSMKVWVLAQNPARTFYEGLGGRLCDERAEIRPAATLDEVAYLFDLPRLLDGAGGALAGRGRTPGRTG
jgi:ribosomal protein S18 acetylase RimI-like enzyme